MKNNNKMEKYNECNGKKNIITEKYTKGKNMIRWKI